MGHVSRSQVRSPLAGYNLLISFVPFVTPALSLPGVGKALPVVTIALVQNIAHEAVFYRED